MEASHLRTKFCYHKQVSISYCELLTVSSGNTFKNANALKAGHGSAFPLDHFHNLQVRFSVLHICPTNGDSSLD